MQFLPYVYVQLLMVAGFIAFACWVIGGESQGEGWTDSQALAEDG